MVTTSKSPTVLDFVILSLFTIFITAQPFYLHHEIIMMDTGIHFAPLHALFRGEIPYRDFVFWRGPLELYIPAMMMRLGGMETYLLPTFFYAGSVLTLLAGIFLAGQIYRSRLILYVMAPVLIARTFPRISYYYWGGMRYFLGMLAMICAVQGFKKQKISWMFAAGMVCCLCVLTTIEAGVSTVMAILLGMAVAFGQKALDRNFIVKSLKAFIGGGLVLFIPYCVYLWATGSLLPYLEITYIVPTQSGGALADARGGYPETFWLFVYSLLPWAPFFKFMTPFYCYIAMFAYLWYRMRKNKLGWEVPALTTISIYGLVLFFASFRVIQGHHFEMALHPEKILLFFLLEKLYFFLKENRDSIWVRMKGVRLKRIYLFRFFVFCLAGSSLGYSVQRFNHRFTMFKIVRNKILGKDVESLKPLQGQETKRMELARVRNMTIPRWQADEIEGVVAFLQAQTAPDEAVFYYPEVGNFAFWADRPFVGRFPIGTFSWIHEKWYQEMVDDFRKAKPKYVVMTHIGHRTFPAAIYFRHPKNIPKFKEVTKLILDNYVLVKSFESVGIYQRKDSLEGQGGT